MKNKGKYTRIEKTIRHIETNEDRIRLLKGLIAGRKSKPNQYSFIHDCLKLFPDNLWPETELADKIEEYSLKYIEQLREENERLRKNIELKKKSFEEFKKIELEIMKLKEKIEMSEVVIKKDPNLSVLDIFTAIQENGVEDIVMKHIEVCLRKSIDSNKKLVEQKYEELEKL
jgi:ATP-dependent 26S proteasome regulatory subunit